MFWYVYVLQSEEHANRFYIGLTTDLHAQVAKHNAGDVSHTSKHKPWRVRTAVAFDEQARAVSFEKYLKSSSGRAFSRKRL